MIQFLLTAWWFYVPIIAVLLYLTRRNNQRINELKEVRKKQAETQQGTPTATAKAHQSRIKRAAGKIGLSGMKQHSSDNDTKK